MSSGCLHALQTFSLTSPPSSLPHTLRMCVVRESQGMRECVGQQVGAGHDAGTRCACTHACAHTHSHTLAARARARAHAHAHAHAPAFSRPRPLNGRNGLCALRLNRLQQLPVSVEVPVCVRARARARCVCVCVCVGVMYLCSGWVDACLASSWFTAAAVPPCIGAHERSSAAPVL